MHTPWIDMHNIATISQIQKLMSTRREVVLESLAGGNRPRSRRHFIPASLSLPFVRVPF
jgi:hypothetical protein